MPDTATAAGAAEGAEPAAPVPASPGQMLPPELLARVADAGPVDQVIVRHEDGTVKGYRPEEWPADTDDGQIIARTSPDRPGYYAPHAGPDSPRLSLGDLAGPDGVITVGRVRYVYPKKPDAGAP